MALGIYVHIPFCLRRCGYCSFASQTDYGLEEAYFTRLDEEIAGFEGCEATCLSPVSAGEKPGFGKQRGGSACDFLLETEHCSVDTIYFGGGTPSSVSPGRLAGALRAICGRFLLESDPEITMECNPATVEKEVAEAWITAGFNRFSVGLQSANDRTLERIGRLHRAADFTRTMAVLRAAGAQNLSADLILGLPGEGVKDVERSARFALDSGIVHLSAYGLSVEEGTPLCASGYRVDEDLAADCYEAVREVCREYGLERYEVSNFACPGRECRHNLKYWRMENYAGFGLSAHSLIGNLRRYNTADMAAYLAGAEPLTEEALTSDDVAAETLMLGLRTADGVNLEQWRSQFGYDLYPKLSATVEKYGEFLEIAGNELRFTDRGFYVMNGILGELLEQLPEGEKDETVISRC